MMVRKRISGPGFSRDRQFGSSQSVRVDNLLYLAGQMPVDAEGAVVGAGDMRAQARQTFENLATVLAAAGSSLDDVIAATCYVTHMTDDFFQLWEVKGEFFAENHPAMTVIGVTDLSLPDQRVEIKVTALAH